MAVILVKNLQNKAIDYDNQKERLLDILLKEIDLMHACGGNGRCTTCKVKVTAQSSLPALTKTELNFKNQGKLNEKERLACQLVDFENISIEIPEENQLPHLTYDY